MVLLIQLIILLTTWPWKIRNPSLGLNGPLSTKHQQAKLAPSVRPSPSLLWAVVFLLACSDSPRSHPRIARDELEYIEASVAATGSNFFGKAPFPPIREILRSTAFWLEKEMR